MSKKLSFTVTLTFSDKISDDVEIKEIAENIARAIKNEANNGLGITTDFSDAFTKTIEVKPQFLDDVIMVNVMD